MLGAGPVSLDPGNESRFFMFDSYIVSAERNRILHHRKTGDVWGVYCTIAIFLFSVMLCLQTIGSSNFSQLKYGYDFLGQLCGIAFPHSPYVYWPCYPNQSRSIDLKSPICVSRCPQNASDTVDDSIQYPLQTLEYTNETGTNPKVTVQWVSSLPYASELYGKKYCIPQSETQATRLLRATGIASFWSRLIIVINSISNAKMLVGSSLLIAYMACRMFWSTEHTFFFHYWTSSAIAPVTVLSVSCILVACATFGTRMPSMAALDLIGGRTLFLTGVIGICSSVYVMLSNIKALHRKAQKAACLHHASRLCIEDVPSLRRLACAGVLISIFIAYLTLVMIAAVLAN